MASIRPHITRTGVRGLRHLISTPVNSVVASLASARRHVLPPVSVAWLSAAFLLGGLAAAMLVSAQTQARTTNSPSSPAPVTRQSDREMVAATIARLESDQATLKKQIADLRAQLNSTQGTDARRKTALLDINNEIARQRLESGLVALRGSGVVATFDDTTLRSIPENEDPANYILHDYDLRDVLNALWVAGAEAISVNGERIASSTSLYCVGTTVICNATRLSPPYEVHAIGDPQALAAALQGSPQMESFNRRARIYDLPVKITQSQDVSVPAYNGSFVFKYAQVPGK